MNFKYTYISQDFSPCKLVCWTCISQVEPTNRTYSVLSDVRKRNIFRYFRL